VIISQRLIPVSSPASNGTSHSPPHSLFLSGPRNSCCLLWSQPVLFIRIAATWSHTAFSTGILYRTHEFSVHPSAVRQPQNLNSISSSFATQCSAYRITRTYQQENKILFGIRILHFRQHIYVGLLSLLPPPPPKICQYFVVCLWRKILLTIFNSQYTIFQTELHYHIWGGIERNSLNVSSYLLNTKCISVSHWKGSDLKLQRQNGKY